MIKTILVDDEKHALESLSILLEMNFPGRFEILAMCNSVDQALPAIQQHEPDLIFLDIQMPQKNGFDLLEKFPQRDFEVIFTTAHKEHGIDAIKNEAFDYLLKPIDIDELHKTISRFFKKNKPIDETLLLIEKQLKKHQVIVLKSQELDEYIPLEKILYLKAEGNYTEFYLEGGERRLISKSIGYFEKRLETSNLFVRLHHSILANCTKFQKYEKKEGYMILKNGDKVSVSVRKSANLNEGFY
ncbi:MAG TPA: DNA-binding response regulator [Algoriphagus sp.]|jgi:two-component system LytT family response regulator|uniref:Two component transcriptional regulator, LytTR family n=1 Tax=Algoriphagus ornithinivorans TaxID=226506 RepID=A0A1I5JFK4_9BACT|nr:MULTISPECIES: LytTR family DNA-binding domain-containing protein [Algoriphagus]MAL15491.1 DNA-binding response regulator [Algoriphagus sp.]MAN86953.1 DNA-binding response regulator [Algoriphagus sp.]QYH41115.1 response regulator transcription factor [Algoriphagus sp. NBT04N3]SFO71121.1 two component transcriptional regulator, LytTR family [Algoriphagus ornithinivorans]HAD52063.1 DNA-binding response regulator [Algoriphagus sp.]|tara:strand:- start:107 stop:835 length:729 start_codon:yes stop_codon:yes gene_type:complete